MLQKDKAKKTEPEMEVKPEETVEEKEQAETAVPETDEEQEAAAEEEVSEEEAIEPKADEASEAVKAAEAAIMEKMMRLQADFENYKRRSQKEKTDIYNHAMESLMTKLLPVIDNLERAEAAATENLESFREGVEMIFKSLLNVLNTEGLKEIESEGKAFDPNFHHGVAVGEDPDQDDQVVLEVFQKGYTFKDKVIRPAMVKVNQK